jgi:hypothetical protein
MPQFVDGSENDARAKIHERQNGENPDGDAFAMEVYEKASVPCCPRNR